MFDAVGTVADYTAKSAYTVTEPRSSQAAQTEVELKTFGARNIHSSFLQVLHAAPTKRKTAIMSSFAVTFTFSFACFR